MIFGRRVLWVCGVMFLLFGLGYLVAPASLAAPAGLGPDASGLTDIRATYGGFQLGFGAFLVACARAPARHALGLLSLALVVGGAWLGWTRVRVPEAAAAEARA